MPVPDRWDNYCPMGKVIPGTKFLAFKVPLKEQLLQNVAEKDKFSPQILLSNLEKDGKKLGLLIDLTFTTKYYNSRTFMDQSVLYKKILVPGAKSGQLVPSDDIFQEFVEAVKGLDNTTEGNVIGVHCTHGVNRTGYLICRYMIEEMDFEPQDAVTLFHSARGHAIERDSYLEDLYLRKKGVPSVTVRPLSEQKKHQQSPRKPRWRHNRDEHPDYRRNRNHDGRMPYSSASDRLGPTSADRRERPYETDWHQGQYGQSYDGSYGNRQFHDHNSGGYHNRRGRGFHDRGYHRSNGHDGYHNGGGFGHRNYGNSEYDRSSDVSRYRSAGWTSGPSSAQGGGWGSGYTRSQNSHPFTPNGDSRRRFNNDFSGSSYHQTSGSDYTNGSNGGRARKRQRGPRPDVQQQCPWGFDKFSSTPNEGENPETISSGESKEY